MSQCGKRCSTVKSFLVFLICLRNHSVYIQAFPIAGTNNNPVGKGVSNDFEQNQMDHALQPAIVEKDLSSFEEFKKKRKDPHQQLESKNETNKRDEINDHINETPPINKNERTKEKYKMRGNNEIVNTEDPPDEVKEADQTISKLEEELSKDEEKVDAPPETVLLKEKLSLKNIVRKFNNLMQGGVPELDALLKVHKDKHKEIDGTINDNKAEGKDHTNDSSTDEKKEKPDNEDFDKLSEDEKRMKLKEILEKLKEDNKALKTLNNNDVYHPPGFNITQNKPKTILRKLHVLKSDKGVFELSINRKFNSADPVNHRTTTSYQQVEHRRLLAAALATAQARVRRPKFRTDHVLRQKVADITIRPYTEVGHSENANFFHPSPPYVWVQVPSHYSYLGLINTPDKFKTTALDRRILAHYNLQVMKRVQAEMREHWGDKIAKDEDKKMKEEYLEDIKRIEKDNFDEHKNRLYP